jgi:hypothetical protein
MAEGEADSGAGMLSAGPQGSRDTFERLYDSASGRLAFDRRGGFWEAVAVAWDQGAVGRGRRIAILDSGFDATARALDGAVAPQSDIDPATVRRRGHHGTLVALLAHEIAPEAQLVLVDVFRGFSLRPDDVARALSRVAAAGVDVINMSLEFSADCRPRDRSAIDLDLLLAPDPPRDAFLEQVLVWAGLGEPYEPGGCREPASLCAALRAVPADTVMVAASGNTERIVAPACLDRVLGLGFERRASVAIAGSAVDLGALPEGFVQSLATELTIPQPAELRGTSFAAPLVAGFAAVVDHPEDLLAMAGLPLALTPVLVLLWRLRTSDQPPAKSTVETLRAGFLELLGTLPPRHRHWEHADPEPCAICSLLMSAWYRSYVALLLGIGRADKALPWAVLAATVMPRSADAAGNLGTTWRRLAGAEAAGSPAQRGLLARAIGQYSRALELRPCDPVWQESLDAAELERHSSG